MSILATADACLAIQGITGREASMVTAHSLSYGTKIAAGVTPGKGGGTVSGVPVYDSLAEAMCHHPINTAIVYVPPAFAFDAGMEAAQAGVRLILVMTERIPIHDVSRLLAYARGRGVRVVGPNSVGILSPAPRVKLGAIGGDNPGRCFVPGGVGILSRSGGMTAECAWMVKKAGLGVSTAVSIGGDPLVGSPPAELLEEFEADPETDAVLLWGEPGTAYEEEVAARLSGGRFTKPLIAYVGGAFVDEMPEGTVFGHAAAFIHQGRGKVSHKQAALRAAGALVAETFDEVIPLLQKALGVSSG